MSMGTKSIESVLIIVLNWNSFSDTKKCVDSLLLQTYKNFKILIIDNNSKDNSLKKLRILETENPHSISVISNRKNLGFAGGINTGIRYAINNSFDAVALINPDATVEKNWLKELVIALKDKGVGIATGLLLSADGKKIDSTGEFYSKWGVVFSRMRDEPAYRAPKSGPVFGTTGGASIYRTATLQEIGLFDERFFMYYEDVDLSFRSQLAGWSVMYTNKAIAYHKRGASSKKVPGLVIKHMFKNLPILFVKNMPTKLYIKTAVRFYLLYILMFLKSVFRGDGVAAIQGVLWAIVLFPYSLIKRYSIQKNRKVTTEVVSQLIWQDLPPNQKDMRKFRKFFTGRD